MRLKAVSAALTACLVATPGFSQAPVRTTGARRPTNGPGCVMRSAGVRGMREDCLPHTPSAGRDMGYQIDINPLPLPAGMGYASHVSSVAINSRRHIFVFHRPTA